MNAREMAPQFPQRHKVPLAKDLRRRHKASKRPLSPLVRSILGAATEYAERDVQSDGVSPGGRSHVTSNPTLPATSAWACGSGREAANIAYREYRD